MSEEIEIEVKDDNAGDRVDIFVSRALPGLSRRETQKLIEDGGVLINGRRCRKGTAVEPGDRVWVARVSGAAERRAMPDPSMELCVAYEDAAVVVIDKPAGRASHPLMADEVGTTANALLARYPEMSDVGYGPLQPGLVNRLDIETSGLLLAARTPQAFEVLRQALKSGAVEKHYTCGCAGRVSAPRILDWYLANDPGDRRKVVACLSETEAVHAGARSAETVIVQSRVASGGSLVVVRALSAFRHQVRVHLATAGHPLWGDGLYGGPEREGLSRHFLHASRLSFEHPENGERIDIESDLPAELRGCLEFAD